MSRSSILYCSFSCLKYFILSFGRQYNQSLLGDITVYCGGNDLKKTQLSKCSCSSLRDENLPIKMLLSITNISYIYFYKILNILDLWQLQ